MTLIDPTRLRQLRKLRDLSQAQLADKARPRLTKQTIHRIESGHQKSIRERTVTSLSTALGVDPEVLSGMKPIPSLDQSGREASDDSTYQLNARLNGAVRNAFSLVALRYKIPVSRIVELAPFLFTVVAEQSLKRRRDKLDELRDALGNVERLDSNFPHLPVSIASTVASGEAIHAEQKSINERDIFAVGLPEEIFQFGDFNQDYDEDSDNPFAAHLKELSSQVNGAAELEYFGPKSFTSYEVCRDDAASLAGGDARLAQGLLNGWALINEMPRELLQKDAAARVEWMRSKMEPRISIQEEFEKLTPEERMKALGL